MYKLIRKIKKQEHVLYNSFLLLNSTPLNIKNNGYYIIKIIFGIRILVNRFCSKMTWSKKNFVQRKKLLKTSYGQPIDVWPETK